MSRYTVDFTQFRLKAEHRWMLRDSGIRDDVVTARGYWTATKSKQLLDLDFSQFQSRVPALVLPIYGADGEVVGHQVRPDLPRFRDGKPIKYESRAGFRPHLDIPPTIPRDWLTDPSIDLVVTEGIKKADAAVSHGLFCVAILGVWMFRVDDWDKIALTDRKVFIAFDSDVMTKPEVNKALYELKAYLEDKGATVTVIYLPPRPDGLKVGMDDYLLKHTTEEMFALAEGEVREPVSNEPPSEPLPMPAVMPVTVPVKTDGLPVGPRKEAFYGLAGEVVDLVGPFCETDSVAVLVQFLAGYGSAVGLGPHALVGAVRHGSNLFVALIGETSRSRKGTSWAPVEYLLTQADPSFADRIVGGLGSGEALVHQVRDMLVGVDKKGNPVVLDPGVADKRLLLQESELSRLFVVVNRSDSSTLSQYLREAFDGRPIRNLVKGSPASASVHHISLLGQSTPQELRRRLTEDSISNGLGNRITYFMSSRARSIPRPAPFQGADVDKMAAAISQRLALAQAIGYMPWEAKAGQLWDEWYTEVTAKKQYGQVAALSNRAEAHGLRFAVTYALLDASPDIRVPHIEAAIALWEYAQASVIYVFGRNSGNVIADRIHEELLARGRMSRNEIVDLFQRHVSGERLEISLRLLADLGWARRVYERTPGRNKEIWEVIR